MQSTWVPEWLSGAMSGIPKQTIAWRVCERTLDVLRRQGLVDLLGVIRFSAVQCIKIENLLYSSCVAQNASGLQLWVN